MTEITLGFATFVAMTIGLTQIIKSLTEKLDKFIPVFALVFGILLNMSQGVTVNNLLVGIVIGLAASGLWSGTKHMVTD